MKTKSNYFKVLILGAAAALFMLQTSCKKDYGDPPEIPPSSTFVMEFDDFSEESGKTAWKTGDNDNFLVDSTKVNWVHSAFNVFIWNVVIAVNGIVPVAAFVESFNHQAEYDKKQKQWIWAYDFYAVNVKYSAELHGWFQGDDIIWEMYISQEGGFSDVLWYSGVSATDGTNGSWTLNFDANNPTPYIGIEWHKNNDGTSDIKYTNIVPNGPENGGYIKYGITSDTDFDAFYDIYNKGQDNMTAIKWNRTSLAGKVQDEKKFLDTDWHCWNTILEDDICQ